MELNIKNGNAGFDYYAITESDANIIRQQMKGRKFNSGLLLGVSSRCLYGKPQVILCKSLLNGIPFPNNFWLSCPALVKIASSIESSGGVKKLESYIMENSKDKWEIYNRMHARIRVCLASINELDNLKKNNKELYNKFCDIAIGIGGTRVYNNVQVKCIHLQIASFISLGFHPGQEWFKIGFQNFSNAIIKKNNRIL